MTFSFRVHTNDRIVPLTLVAFLIMPIWLVILEERETKAFTHFKGNLVVGQHSQEPRSDCRALFEIPETNTVKTNREGWYRSLAEQLPSLLPKNGDVSSISNVTRLQLMNNYAPFSTCQVHQYGAAHIRRCIEARKRTGTNTWLAFVGDSQMRFKMATVVDLLPQNLEYSYFLGSQEVTQAIFLQSVGKAKVRAITYEVVGRSSSDINNKTKSATNQRRLPSSVEEVKKSPLLWSPKVTERFMEGDYDLRVSLIWAPYGSATGPDDHPKSNEMMTLHKWAIAEKVPDIIVLGYANWFLVKRVWGDDLEPFTELNDYTIPLLSPLKILSARTRVLVWGYSRPRWSSSDIENQEEVGYAKGVGWGRGRDSWMVNLYYHQYMGTIPILDDWLATLVQETGAWRWNSVIPLSLANIAECRALRKAKLHFAQSYNSWWNCKDDIHSSQEMNTAEAQFLLNLLCNSFVLSSNSSQDKNYCCIT